MSQDAAVIHQPPGWEARAEPSSVLISYLDPARWVPATRCWCLLPMAPRLHTLLLLSFGLIWCEVSRSGRGRERGISLFSGQAQWSLIWVEPVEAGRWAWPSYRGFLSWQDHRCLRSSYPTWLRLNTCIKSWHLFSPHFGTLEIPVLPSP